MRGYTLQEPVSLTHFATVIIMRKIPLPCLSAQAALKVSTTALETALPERGSGRTEGINDFSNEAGQA